MEYISGSVANEMILATVAKLVARVDALSDNWGPQFTLSAVRTEAFDIEAVEFRLTTSGFIK